MHASPICFSKEDAPLFYHLPIFCFLILVAFSMFPILHYGWYVQMLCEECSHFLEIAEAIRSLGLTILKGVTEAHGEKTWICFVVEVGSEFWMRYLVLIDHVYFKCSVIWNLLIIQGQNNRNIHRMDILWSLVQILQPKQAMQQWCLVTLGDFHEGFSVKYCESYVIFNRLLASVAFVCKPKTTTRHPPGQKKKKTQREGKNEMQGRWEKTQRLCEDNYCFSTLKCVKMPFIVLPLFLVSNFCCDLFGSLILQIKKVQYFNVYFLLPIL